MSLSASVYLAAATSGYTTIQLAAEKIEQRRFVGIFRTHMTVGDFANFDAREHVAVGQTRPLAVPFYVVIV